MALVFGGTSILFKGTELQTGTRTINSIYAYGGLKKDMAIFKKARSNRSFSTNSSNPQRIIPSKAS
jgi:hypothetical protein